MPSDELQKTAHAINETSLLITKLGNLRHLIADYDRLRMAGAGFLSPQDEEYQEYWADADAIRSLARGPAGTALAAELPDSPILQNLQSEDSSELGEIQLRTLAAALDRALAKAEARMHKLLTG